MSNAISRSRRQGHDLPPLALNDPNMTLVDLFGDGLPDVLHSSPGGFRYWRNLGDGRLDRPRSLPQIPAGVALGQPGVGFGDMGGDGQVDLLRPFRPTAGLFRDHVRRHLANVQTVCGLPQLRSPGSQCAAGRSDGRRPIRRAHDPGQGVPLVRMSGRTGLRAAAIHLTHSTTSTSSRMSFSTIRPDASAWPT